jgi:hypothetical protein
MVKVFGHERDWARKERRDSSIPKTTWDNWVIGSLNCRYSNAPSLTLYNLDFALLSPDLGLVSMPFHQGTFLGIPPFRPFFITGLLFSKNTLKPSVLSSLSYHSHISSESSKCAPSAESGFLYIISRIKYVLTVEVCFMICFANSKA